MGENQKVKLKDPMTFLQYDKCQRGQIVFKDFLLMK